MALLLVSFIAGVLTVLAPCILPLLPIVIGTSVGEKRKSTPFVVIGSLALSILLFTYLLKVSTAFIVVPQYVWGYISGGILLMFGLILLFPSLWEKVPLVAKTNKGANKLVGAGHQKQSVWGDVLIGAALGPVFSSCSPTYFVILATVLPASFLLGTLYLMAYIVGLIAVLALIALLGQRLTSKLQFAADSRGWIKRGIGALFVVVGLFILTGFDKKIEIWVLDRGYIDGVLDIEQQLLDRAQQPQNTQEQAERNDDSDMQAASFDVPPHLATFFSDTDFSNADPALAQAISGGPVKDGIPALDNPSFVPLSEFEYSDTIQAVVLSGKREVKVYPYNILTWHEIVNDTFEGIPVAVTFCPLCGSAVVFNRTLPDGIISTFGVSGSLLESNMIMYDRETENLWQQSTGRTLAGSFHEAQLSLESFQLLSIKEVKNTYPDALVLSDKTGYERDYAHNPYAGYEHDNRFVFEPSNINDIFAPKTIMTVFRFDDTVYALPWLKLRELGSTTITVENEIIMISVSDSGEVTIRDSDNETYPFYFEMWFSVSVQNTDTLQVIKL